MLEQLAQALDHPRRQVVDAEVAAILEGGNRLRFAGAGVAGDHHHSTRLPRKRSLHRDAPRSRPRGHAPLPGFLSRRSVITRPCAVAGGSLWRAYRAPRAPPRAPGGWRPGSRSGEPKWREQRALSGGPDAPNAVQDRCGHRLVAPVSVEGDREPVCLVAHPLQQPQRVGARLQPHRRLAARQEDLLDPLGQADHGHAALGQRLQGAHPGRELSLAAVDHDQVGKGGEAGVAIGVVRREVSLLQVTAQPAAEDLFHRGVIINAAAPRLRLRGRSVSRAGCPLSLSSKRTPNLR